MKNRADTEAAWNEIASLDYSKPSALPRAPSAHPFAKLGPAPYKFECLGHAPEGAARRCALCGKRIKNLYIIRDGENVQHMLGSECILSMGSNGFERHLVGEVTVAKKRYEKQKRYARRAERIARERAAAAELTETVRAKEAAWLRTYSGNFDFYLSLKRQLEENGGLSENQWNCVVRAIEKQNAPKPVRTFSLAAGTVLTVSKFLGYIIGRHYGLNRPHFAIEVLEVQAETERAYKVRCRISAHRTSFCSVCGKSLSNPVSVVNGIGPICADRYGVSTTEELQAMFATEYKAELELWVPKSQIKERKAANETKT